MQNATKTAFLNKFFLFSYELGLKRPRDCCMNMTFTLMLMDALLPPWTLKTEKYKQIENAF